MSTVLCVISGGMDSATLLHKAISNVQSSLEQPWCDIGPPPNSIAAISFDYGQRHEKELGYASVLCKSLGIRHDVIDIKGITPYIGGSALTDDIDVPEGHYAADNMSITVVPNRNAIMLAIAYGVAVARGSKVVGAAMHSGDHTIYPDCRPPFVEAFHAMEKFAVEGHGDPDLFLWTPYINMSKTDIAREGGTLNVDYSLTWSCYQGGDRHCGKCGTCYERREAFLEAEVPDPTEYEVVPLFVQPLGVVMP